jgi:hypothetical protein
MLHGLHSPQTFPIMEDFLVMSVQGSDNREDDLSWPAQGDNVADTPTTQVLEEHGETHAKITSFQVEFKSSPSPPCPIRNMADGFHGGLEDGRKV